LLRGVEDVARYLAALALAGQFEAIEILRLYYVEGCSPSDVGSALGVPKSRVQSYVQRIREKVGSQRASFVLKWLMPRLKGVSPVINGKRCLLCGEPIVNLSPTVHIILFHRDHINKVVESILNGGERR
jgi:hypothetical protein